MLTETNLSSGKKFLRGNTHNSPNHCSPLTIIVGQSSSSSRTTIKMFAAKIASR